MVVVAIREVVNFDFECVEKFGVRVCMSLDQVENYLWYSLNLIQDFLFIDLKFSITILFLFPDGHVAHLFISFGNRQYYQVMNKSEIVPIILSYVSQVPCFFE